MARVLVEAQAAVQPKATVVVLQDISRLKVSIDVPETLIAQATPGLSLEERSELIQPEVVVTSIPGRSWPCAIYELAGEPDPATRTFRCTFVLPMLNDVMLLPGMSAGCAGGSKPLVAASRCRSQPLSAAPTVARRCGLPIRRPWVSSRVVELGTPGDGRGRCAVCCRRPVVETGVAWLREGMVVRRLGGE